MAASSGKPWLIQTVWHCSGDGSIPPGKVVSWKPVKGSGLFVDEYEDEFERRQRIYFLAAGDGKKLLKKADALLRRNAAHAGFVNTLGVHCCNDGAPVLAKHLFATALQHAPESRDAQGNLAALPMN